MRKKFDWVIAIGLVLLVHSRASAWLESGHRETALIAWDDLTPLTRTKVAEILKHHPRYQQDLLDHLPANSSPEEISRYAFSSAAVWPDTVKSLSNPMNATHNHPTWHYIDIPYAIDGQAIPAAQSGTTKPPANILEAMAKNTADLKDHATTDADRAIALCWVLHLCGDIHQPLHACTLYSPQFPNGDAGGTSFMVMRDPPYPDSVKSLHFIWDAMPGEFRSQAYCAYFAHGIKEDPQYSREKLKDLLAVRDFSAWADESHRLAIEYVYLDGSLKGGTKPARGDAPTTRSAKESPVPGLPAEYLRKAEGIAGQRIVLGGYRTADLLNSIFDPKPSTPDNAH